MSTVLDLAEIVSGFFSKNRVSSCFIVSGTITVYYLHKFFINSNP